jgi:hypothetical protein
MCAKTTKQFSREERRVAIELWRAKMPLKTIRDKVKLSESTLRRIWPLPKKSTLVAGRKVGSGRPLPHKQDHPEGHEEEAAQFPHHYCQAAE